MVRMIPAKVIDALDHLLEAARPEDPDMLRRMQRESCMSVRRVLEEIDMIVLLRGMESCVGIGPHRSDTVVADHQDLWELKGDALVAALYRKVFDEDVRIVDWEAEAARDAAFREGLEECGVIEPSRRAPPPASPDPPAPPL